MSCFTAKKQLLEKERPQKKMHFTALLKMDWLKTFGGGSKIAEISSTGQQPNNFINFNLQHSLCYIFLLHPRGNVHCKFCNLTNFFLFLNGFSFCAPKMIVSKNTVIFFASFLCVFVFCNFWQQFYFRGSHIWLLEKMAISPSSSKYVLKQSGYTIFCVF